MAVPSMQFLQSSSASGFAHPPYLVVPDPWQQYEHPNGDIYYYNPPLRLITPEDIRDPAILNLVLEARDDHVQDLEDGPGYEQLADDWELTLSDVTEDSAITGIYSRKAGVSYTWNEETGLQVAKTRETFWSFVAEYPSHHNDLPPNTETEFVQALSNAKTSLTSGATFPLSGLQIEQVIYQYHYLKTCQSQGRNVIPALGWLMGAVMPLDECDPSLAVTEGLEAMMKKMQF